MALRQIVTTIMGGAMAVAVLYLRITSIRTQEASGADEEEQNTQADLALGAIFQAVMNDDPARLLEAAPPMARVMTFAFMGPSNTGMAHVIALPVANHVTAPALLQATSANVVPTITLSARLAAVNCDDDDVPEEFFDPISFELMEDPVIAVTEINNNGRVQKTEHVYDRASYQQLNGICPENRLPFIEVRDATELRARIVAFVDERAPLSAQTNNRRDSVRATA